MTVGILQLSVQWNKNKRKILKMHLVAEQLYHFWSSCKSKLMIILFDQKNCRRKKEIYRNSYFFLRFWRATHNFHLETLWCFTTSMTSGCCIAGGVLSQGNRIVPLLWRNFEMNPSSPSFSLVENNWASSSNKQKENGLMGHFLQCGNFGCFMSFFFK